jgi:lysophospholipase L1-like esterase
MRKVRAIVKTGSGPDDFDVIGEPDSGGGALAGTNLYVIGDSVTQGVGAVVEDTEPVYPNPWDVAPENKAASWPALLKDALGLGNLVNAGQSGASIAGEPWRYGWQDSSWFNAGMFLQQALDVPAGYGGLVLVFMGHNDMTSYNPDTTGNYGNASTLYRPPNALYTGNGQSAPSYAATFEGLSSWLGGNPGVSMITFDDINPNWTYAGKDFYYSTMASLWAGLTIIRNKCPSARIAVVSPLDWITLSAATGRTYTYQNYRDAIAWVAENRGVPYLDISWPAGLSGRTAYLAGGYASPVDQVHPSAAGQALIAQSIQSALENQTWS